MDYCIDNIVWGIYFPDEVFVLGREAIGVADKLDLGHARF